MTVIRNVTRPLFRSMFSSVIQDDAAITRFFTTLVASGSMYYTIPTVTLTGDFVMPFEFTTTETVGFDRIFEADDGQNRLFLSGASGTIIARVSGDTSQNINPIVIVNDGKLHKGTYTRVGDLFTLTVDGVPSSVTITGVSFTVSSIGLDEPAAGQSWSGILANIGFPGRFYPIDEDFATTTVLKNSLAVLGPELVTTTPIVANVQAGAFNNYPTGAFKEVGKTYTISATVSNYTGTGTVGFAASGGIIEAARSSNGVIETAFEATNTSEINVFNRDTNSCIFENITVKQADGYGTAQNISSSDFYLLNDAGTIWLNQSGGSDLDIA